MDFISSTGVDGLRHVSDESGDIWQQYEITSQPAWVFIDAEGNAETLISSLGEDGLRERVEALLAA